jgi:argininosuccinate lyase
MSECPDSMAPAGVPAGKYEYSVNLGSHDSRLKGLPAESVVEGFYRRWLEGTSHLFDKLIEYNKAHVVELHEAGIVSPGDAVKLLETLRWMESKGIEGFKLDPALEDLAPNMEGIVVSRLGEVGGRLLTGRARGEVTNVAIRLLLREKFLRLMGELNALRAAVLALAREHVGTVMPGYTHAQHAQPTTLGHYLACVAEAFETDFSRLEDTYKRLNTSFAESGIGQGTAYPIDRQRVASLLGFDGLVENTRYALLCWDRTVEVLAQVAILAVNINRFSDDLFYWCTFEFGMVELADEYSATSYIMPQKKNPYVLEELSVIPGRAIAAFAQDAVRWNRVSFGLATHLGGVKADPTKTVLEVCEAARMLTGVVETLSINEDLMKDRAGAHFTQASELADTLVREKGISFRTAHRVIGTVVRKTLAAGKKPCEIDTAMIDEAAIEVTGTPMGLAVDVLRRALDPVEIIRARKVLGGTAPTAVESSLGNRTARLVRDQEWLACKQSAVSGARQRLEKTVDALLAG